MDLQPIPVNYKLGRVSLVPEKMHKTIDFNYIYNLLKELDSIFNLSSAWLAAEYDHYNQQVPGMSTLILPHSNVRLQPTNPPTEV